MEHWNPDQEDDGDVYPQIAIGLVFLIGGIVAGFVVNFWVTFGLMIPAAALLGDAISTLAKQRRALPRPVSKERELLSALRDNGGHITPAEAAMETSLTVKEADALLSELAGGGHLLVESRGGVLSYTLPAGSTGQRPELEDRM